jgi:hypothetical protein
MLSGALGALAVYNLGVFLHLGRVEFLWLSLFLVASTLNLMVSCGTAPMVLWPDPSLLSQRAMSLTSLAVLALGALLCAHVLRDIPRARPLIAISGVGVAIAAVGVGLTFFALPKAFYLGFLGGVLALIALIAITILAIRSGLRKRCSTLAFLCGWGVVLLSALVVCLTGPGYLHASPFTDHLVFVAILVAAIGWSFTLTAQIKAQERAQRRALEAQVEARTVALAEAKEEVKTLHGLLPICCSCKKIRDDDGYWQHVETYLSERTTADFSHGLCPECAGDLYPDYFQGSGCDRRASSE